jgi:dienelactone hydrolase
MTEGVRTMAEPSTTGLAVLELAQAGRFAEVRERFAPQLRAVVAAEALQAAWEAEIGRSGAVRSVGTPRSEPAHAGVVVVRVPVRCERGAFTLVASATEDGSLVGLQLAPAAAAEPAAPWSPPPYADPGAFEEQEVAVGSGPLAVPGTLSLPRAVGTRPAVVLLAGSGPNDRDGTLGRNKPLKDLAWGLATRGVAVLRFDKVTFAHPREALATAHFTVVDEYVPQAVAAIRLLQQHSAVDGRRVFVAGHSLGGTVAPRVAAAEPSVAGLIILGGGAQPLHWALVRQMRHLASLNPATAAASAPAIAAATAQAQLVDSPELGPSTPASALPFGVPASYWLDLRDYRPAEAAAALGKPVLLLQGGRDYQVTVEDDLAVWKAGLAGRPNVTVRIHDADNHMFFAGSGTPTPADYEAAQHVDPQVVEDIAEWMDGH